MTSSITSLQSKSNPQQLEAILATDGPVLIIAGPGSGKTFTLVERIVYLITHKGVAPESLLVVTFTDKAARELTTRISNRLSELGIKFNLNEMYLGTFHSICLRILENFREFTRLKRSFTLFDQFDQQYFLYQRIKKFRELPDSHLVMGDDQSGRWAQSENLLKWLNKVSEEALDVATLVAAPEVEIRALAACFAKYQELLHENNSLDFSGIQYEALQLLEKCPEVLAQLREKLTYLMVDEYQDTNTIQERILLLLAGEKRNLCVVGDDDQGLYRFRGATIRNILEFPALFDEGQCKRVSLTVNYRSHPDIIRFYNEWMREQTWDDGTRVFRFPKQIVPREDVFPDVPTAVRLAATDNKDETTNWHAEMLAFLNSLKASGKLSDWNQVAFLFRSVKNDKVVALAHFLEAQGVPVFSPRSNMFFEREEIRLMIGALIFLFPQFPKVRAWAEGVTLPIWDYYDQQCFAAFTTELRKPGNKPLLDWARPLAKRHAVLTQNTDYSFSGLFYQLLQFPLFARFLAEDAAQGVDKGRAARNLGTFSKLLTKFEYLHFVSVLNPEWLEKNIRDLFNQFLRFLVEGGIGEYEDEAEYAPKGCVSFSPSTSPRDSNTRSSSAARWRQCRASNTAHWTFCWKMAVTSRRNASSRLIRSRTSTSGGCSTPLSRARRTCWYWPRRKSKDAAGYRQNTSIGCSTSCRAGAKLTSQPSTTRRSSRSTSNANIRSHRTSPCSRTAPSSTASSRSWSSPRSAKVLCCLVRWCIKPSRTFIKPFFEARRRLFLPMASKTGFQPTMPSSLRRNACTSRPARSRRRCCT